MNRSDRREPIFQDGEDRRRFLATLGEVCAKTGWEFHALCLMPNHFHLVVETPQPNLVAGMKWFLGTYTSRFNRRHKLFGLLFSGRYRTLIVVDSGDQGLDASHSRHTTLERPARSVVAARNRYCPGCEIVNCASTTKAFPSRLTATLLPGNGRNR